MEVQRHHATILLAFAARAIAFLNSLLAVRYVLPRIGVEEFGLLVSIVSLSALVTLFDLGIGTGLQSTAAKPHLADGRIHLGDTLANALVASCGIGLVLACSLFGFTWSALEAAEQGMRWKCSALAALFGFALVLGNTTTKLFLGSQQGGAAHGPAIVAQLSIAAFMVWDAQWLKLEAALAVLALFPVAFTLVLQCIRVALARDLKLRPSSVSLVACLKLMHVAFGPWMCQAVSSLIAIAPIYVALAIGGPAFSAEIFSVHRISSILGILVMLAAQPLWAEYIRLAALGRSREIQHIYQRNLWFASAAAASFLVVEMLAVPSLNHWLKQDTPHLAYLASGVWTAMQAFRFVMTMLLLGVGECKYTYPAHAVAAFAVFGLAFAPAGFGITDIYLCFVAIEAGLLCAHLADVRRYGRANWAQ